MIGSRRVMHTCDATELAQARGKFGSIRALVGNAEVERLQTAIEQVASLWIEAASQVIQPALYVFDELGAASHRTRDDVGMAVEVLGRAMEDEVVAQVRRAKVDGRCDGVVYQARETVGLAERDDRFMICDTQQRVGDRFDVECARLFVERGFPCFRTGCVDERMRNVQSREFVRHERMRSSIELFVNKKVITALQHCEERAGNRCHAARSDQCAFGLLEAGQLVVQ